MKLVEAPRFRHDCDRCRFLGRFPTQTYGEIDLWWCVKPSGLRSLDSVIGRFSDDGPDYAATHPPEAFADPAGYLAHAEPWYLAALELATALGVYQRRG